MGLKNCKECQSIVSTSAKVCPHCGIKYPTGGFSLPAKIFLILGGLYILGSVAGHFDKSDNNQPAISQNQTPSKPREEMYYLAKEMEEVQVGHITYFIKNSTWTGCVGTDQLVEQADARFLIINLTVGNHDKEPRPIPPFRLIDENGFEYGTSSKCWRLNDAITSLDSLNPNVYKNGSILFDVPTNHQYKLRVSGGFGSRDEANVKLSPKEKKD